MDNSERKSKMISMRMTEKQFQYLEDIIKKIRDHTGVHITRASIILKMMEYGYPYLEKEFSDKKKSM